MWSKLRLAKYYAARPLFRRAAAELTPEACPYQRAHVRDIDQVIQQVRRRYPDVKVDQHLYVWPADDEGLWWFSLPHVNKNIQVESSYGNCPFIVETDELNSHQARTAATVEEAVGFIEEFLESVSGADRAG
jgi:hypothetical protein